MAKNTFKIQFEDGTTKTANVTIISPKDIVMFVAGTTDPINTTGAKHQANRDYWRTEKKDFKNLRASIKDLKLQFNDLHIEDEFFSWSGDNNNADRTVGADRLLDLFYRLYPNWKNKHVYFHLIGHSHGGNVINEFTNVIAKDSGFPKKWKVKSITYLSTPFFKEQHQLNHTHIHPDANIINVHNKYDITQRFVADFSLKNLEVLIANYTAGDFDSAINRIKETDFDIYEQLGGSYVINNHTEGPHMWEQTIILLDGVAQLMDVVIGNLQCFETTLLLSSQKVELLTHFNRILLWATTQRLVFEGNRTGRDGGYGRAEFFEDIDLVEVLGIINTLFAIDTGVKDSYLLTLLNDIFQTSESGILDKTDDTSWTPEKQVNGKYKITQVPIFDKDPYHKKSTKSNYDGFISGVENAMIKNKSDVREVLMRLLSQIIPQGILTGDGNVPDTLDSLMWLYTDDDIDNGLAAARDNLRVYGTLTARFNANLITAKDLANDNLDSADKPGSLVYLATKAHSLSHSKLWDDVEKMLKESFGSGINPGYKG